MNTYSLKLADHLMEQARKAAEEDNVPLDQLLSSFIADGIGHRRAMLGLRRRAERGDPELALTILDRAPATNPEPNDRL